MCNLPNWIQAVTAIGLLLVTSWTLIVLLGYARDTKSIAGNTSQQLESSQMPFIALVMLKSGQSSNWAIKNQGFGPALNIFYSRYVRDNEPPIRQWLTPLAPLEDYALDNRDADLAAAGGFTVEYESLSGKKYRTTVERVSGVWKHTFQKPG